MSIKPPNSTSISVFLITFEFRFNASLASSFGHASTFESMLQAADIGPLRWIIVHAARSGAGAVTFLWHHMWHFYAGPGINGYRSTGDSELCIAGHCHVDHPLVEDPSKARGASQGGWKEICSLALIGPDWVSRSTGAISLSPLPLSETAICCAGIPTPDFKQKLLQ